MADRLYRAGYTEPRLRQLWGSTIASALVRNNAAPAIHFCQKVLRTPRAQSIGESNDYDLAVLAMLFQFHREVSTESVRAALGEDAFRVAAERGMIATNSETEASNAETETSSRVLAPYAITPYDLPVGVPRGFRPGDENVYLASDHGTLVNPHVLDGDFVLGLGGAGRTLVSLTPREHVGVSADIGTGCGIQALLLARHSAQVIATDVSDRALFLADLSARLNGVTNIEFRAGSMLDPLAEPVDLLVSNPPFVITPRTLETNFEYRDGGMSGDRLVRSLFSSIPDFLRPNGRSVCLGNWEITSARATGPETWATDPDTSVLVIEREVLDPVAYAETWIRDGGIPRAGEEWNAATADWMDDFASRDVTEIAFGYVIMRKLEDESGQTGSDGSRRPDNDVPTIACIDRERTSVFKTKVRTTSAIANNPHGLGQFVDTNFALRSWLESADTKEIANTVFTRSPDLVEHRHFVPGESDPSSITLEQGIGFGQVFDLDSALAGFVSVADGSLTLRQTARALSQLLDVNPTALEDQLIAQVRQLVAAGVLLPVTE